MILLLRQPRLSDSVRLGGMCGRVMQAGGPLHYAIMDGLNVRDSRLDNYPRRWNGAPSQEFLVIRENRKTGERAQTDQREVGDGRNAAHLRSEEHTSELQ